MNIPEDVLEATAKALMAYGWGPAKWDQSPEAFRSEYRGLARAALEAAYPAIRHMAAREALDGLIAKHDQSASRHPAGSAARFDEQRAAFRIMAYRDAEYPEAD